MKANRTRKSFSLFAVLFAVVAASAGGCMVLQNTPLGELFNFDLIGTTPSEDGLVGFNVLAAGSQSFEGLDAEGAKVEVLNSDGSYSQCAYKGQEIEEGSKYNSLSLLLDDSGSMGIPQDQIPDGQCPTCPHDPLRLRADAAKALIVKILEAGPESSIGVMRFGPAVSSGYIATEVLADFGNELDPLVEALGKLDGAVSAGTPFWDSLSEVLGDTDEAAQDLEVHLQTVGIKENGQDPEVKRYIVVLSDGADTDSTVANLESVIAQAKDLGIAVYAIGLGPAAITVEMPALQVEE